MVELCTISLYCKKKKKEKKLSLNLVTQNKYLVSLSF